MSTTDISRDNLADLSLEELGNIEITSVSKRAEKLSDAAASIFVITNEDIRRAGVTSLPEALRLAPNLEVARTNAGEYAISARGFNNAIGNKLLVLIDGRTVYTPMFSGVNWDSQFVMLEDVERIEVISGPGATLWGANAVNGVINVITRRAQDSQGALVAADVGNRDTGAATRYGGKIGTNGYYRVYGMGFNRKHTQLSGERDAQDGQQNGQVGFRADWNNAQRDFTLQGDTYQGTTDQNVSGTPKVSGSNLLARWTRRHDNGSNSNLQAYFDNTVRDDPFSLRDEINTLDLQFQRAVPLAVSHKLLWGGGYRYALDKTHTYFDAPNRFVQVFMPTDRTLQWGNLFVQDDWSVRPSVNLTFGVKAETNVYTNVEYLPSMRLAWKPHTGQLVWGAVSRAVRAPARIDRDFYLYYSPRFLQPPPHPLISVINGGPGVQSEIADVIEIGYRAQPTQSLSYSVTAFHSAYDKLRSGQPPPGALVQNMGEGTTYGIESWGSYQVTRAWRISAGWTELRENLKVKPGSLDPTAPRDWGNDPKFQWSLRSSHSLTANTDFDIAVRHVAKLPNPVVPAYTEVDARLGWRPRAHLELSLTLQNLFDPDHVEFGAPTSASEIDRAVLFKVQWGV